MKKKIFKAFVAYAAVAVVGISSYKAYGSYMAANMSGDDLLLTENVLALSDVSGDKTVSCYCKTKWFSPNICSANASGNYCGGNPCDQNDGNCR